jgi:hypothetical protein
MVGRYEGPKPFTRPRGKRVLVQRLKLESVVVVDPANKPSKAFRSLGIIPERVVESHVGKPVSVSSINRRNHRLTSFQELMK